MDFSKDIAIVGNGASRLSLKDEILQFSHIWVCNEGYKDFPHVERVYSVHDWVLEEAKKFFSTFHEKPLLIGRNAPPADSVFFLDLGWSTGNQALLDALLSQEENSGEKVYLYGFDFGGEDAYKSYPLEGSNFRKQFNTLKSKVYKFEERLELRYPKDWRNYGKENFYFHDGRWVF